MFRQLYEATGVLLGKAFGEEYPDAFTHPLIEYRALTTRAALVDLTHWGALRLTGADRVRFLNNMITGNVASLGTGEGCKAVLTTVKGKLVAELLVLARTDELFVLVTQGDHRAVFEALDKHIIADDVELEDASDRYGVMSVEGPKCRELVWKLFPDSPLPLEAMRFADTDYQDIPVTIVRGSVTGEKGLQLVVPADGIARIRDYLIQSGASEDAELCGRVAWNMRRIENGLPWWGVDVDGNFPAESRLDHLVDYEKGCYLGQETLARMHFRGHPNWLLVGLRCSQLALPSFFDQKDEELTSVEENPDVVLDHINALSLVDVLERNVELFSGSDASAGEQKPSGRLTSLTFSPRLRAALFLGYVRAPLAERGNEFVFSTGDEVTKTTITQLPIEESK
jgi:folate-binding protein YgfZ